MEGSIFEQEALGSKEEWRAGRDKEELEISNGSVEILGFREAGREIPACGRQASTARPDAKIEKTRFSRGKASGRSARDDKIRRLCRENGQRRGEINKAISNLKFQREAKARRRGEMTRYFPGRARR